MSIKLKDTISDLINNSDKLDGKHASDFALSSHGIHWKGFIERTSKCTWGTLIEDNGYTPIFWMDSSLVGGGVAFSDKGSQTSMQINGFLYQNEGKYLVLDTNNFSTYAATKGHTHSNYLTSLPTHSHDYLPLTGGTLTGNLALESDGSYRKISIGKSSEYYAVFHNSTYNGDEREASIAWYNGNAVQGAIGVKTFPFFVNSSGVVYTLYHTGNLNINNLNADTLDGYHESSFWRNDATNKIWNPSTNIKMAPSASGQEWSFDFRDKGSFTGSYWQVWDESKTTLLKVDADSGVVSAPYGFSGSLSGNASTATALTSNAGSATNPVYFSGGKPVACTYTLGKSVPSNAVFTDTNTWRGITDSYSGTSSDISLSQKGAKALYDALSHSHNYHPLGGTWKPTSLSSYTRHWGWVYSSANAGLASDGNDMQVYTDGKFWQREGAYYCLDNGNTYVSNGYGVINGSTITTVNYASSAGSADFAGLLTKQGGTSTSVATWNPLTSYTKVWGQKFINTSISSDSGDILYYLRSSSYSSGGTELCVCIDGDYYAGTGQYKVIHAGNIGSQSVSYASSSGNADTVDGYHASSLWRSDGGTWNPGANIALNATANSQEWSFNITRNGKTGCHWHVWDSSLGSMLGVNADNGLVTAYYTFNCAALQIGGQTITFVT